MERNHLRIVPVWHRALSSTDAPPAPGSIHLSAQIHATQGNPNGFARGEWVPYLNVQYTIEPVGSGSTLRGTLRPIIGSDGPHYGANVTLSDPGDYRLTLRIEPPSREGLERVVDPAAGVAPWWNPFELKESWSYRRD